MRRMIFGAALLCLVGCTREVYVTPLTAPLPSHLEGCRLAVETVPQPGTQAVAVLRCTDALMGRSCWELLRERACEAGGEVIFGAHYESTDLVATVGTIPAEPTNATAR
jgi:hypothetical protein